MALIRSKLSKPYLVMLAVYAVMLVAAFAADTPAQIGAGLLRIITSPGMLITDYAETSGLGAMLVNSVLVGILSVAVLVFAGISPNGAIIAALWVNSGFAFFGKNPFNMIPLMLGVILYARIQKESLVGYSLATLMAATLSPVVSAICFMESSHPYLNFLLGIALGIVAGFIFPVISAYCVRVHAGYDLYNMGFAGGIISTFIVSVLKSMGVEIESTDKWSTGNDLMLSLMLYAIAVLLILFGVLSAQRASIRPNLKKMMRQSGRLVSDFYILYKDSVYVNMGILCAFITSLVLILKIDLNGPIAGGIFTIVGFGAFGKHLRNIVPVLMGSVLSTIVNMWDPSAPMNSMAILFSTCLAPIAGHFGWGWGIAAGFLHVNIAVHIGYLNSGLNLYNNGYAAGFVALFLVPLILEFRKEATNEA